MFESATFESMGIIRTRSSRWMGAVLFFDVALLLALVLIPLLHPQALSGLKTIYLITAPAPEPQTPPQPKAQAAATATVSYSSVIVAPREIPTITFIPDSPEPPVDTNVGAWVLNPALTGTIPFGPGTGRGMTVVRPAVSGPVRISSGVAESEIMLKTIPVYPPIARASRVEGTVRLVATISKTGSIENLRVTGGPAMLQQAALNAVSCWRYKPYLLDGLPVEVETTVDVIFTLSR
jgi:protein TonB